MTDIPEEFVDVSEPQDKGVLKKVIREGTSTETPPDGVEVEVHYVGTVFGGEKDGEKFDSSRDRNEHFKFKIGEGQVIKAWDQGVASMKKGELAELICSPSYAYGEAGSGDKIPPNSTLKFEVELFGWKGKDVSPDKDESMIESTIKKGEKYETPKDCAQVTIHIKGEHGDKVVMDKDATFEIGEAEEHELPACVDHLVKEMKLNQVSKFDVKSRHCWGSAGLPKLNIPPNADLAFTIELKEFEEFKETYGLDSNAEKFEYTEQLKNRGTEKFKKSKFAMANKLYKKATKYIKYDSDYKEDEDKQKRKDLQLALHLNQALCLLKMKDFSQALSQCNDALEIDPKSEKALFRQGQAYVGRSDFLEAIASFKQVLSMDPDNKAASAQINLCSSKIKEMEKKEKNLYKSMMGGIKLPPKLPTPQPEQNGQTEQNGKMEHDETEVKTSDAEKMVEGDVKA